MKFSVQIGNHLSRDTLILDMCVAVRKATALLTKLVSSHLDFASPFNEFL
jgi:hypothetical protein